MNSAFAVLAESGAHDHAWWPLLWLVWLALIGAVIVLGARRGWFGRRSNARTILAERYARGEIGAEEYRERLDNLR
jgi:putative membrane protein